MELSYKQYIDDIKKVVAQERIYTDDLRCLAWGTDAGFYRKIPQIVIRSKTDIVVFLHIIVRAFDYVMTSGAKG